MGGGGRAPCCDKSKVKRGPWSPAEDLRLINFIQKNGHSNWRSLPKQAGLLRCGKSCRLRWINYLSPDVKRGNFTPQEEQTIINLHNSIGNKWSKIASYLPGRTDNEIKNMWNTHLKKRITRKLDENSQKTEADESKMHHSASPSCTTSSITTSGHEIVRENYETLKLKSSEGELKETASSYHESNMSHPNLDKDASRPNEESGFSKSGFIDDQQNGLDNGKMEIQFDSDIDFWELIDSLDPLQFTKTEQNDGNKDLNNFDSDFECGKWLRLLEDELGLSTSDTDTDHVPKEQGQEFNLEPEISPDLDYFPIWPISP
ncbi:hypothetical protein RD792_007534 [Penstemon davidsonii]|uniref:Uncharacterized protein n=1 Tax=Penstemon davidsonii TaxID=160366 RepID=A0ABR0D816_9LAMI|nr:hypothetical protein RD792_007534 [Penstemon davidsonii]